MGSSINSGTVTTGSFSNTSINLTSITSGSFDGSSINKSTVSTASFLGSAINSGTVTTGSFLGTSINLTNVCNASFAGSSINRATLINDVTFAGSSINGGIVKNATFSETAKNTGSVTGLGSFLGSSSNSGIVQNAIFSGSGYNLGTINSSGSFYGTASNSGTVSGNAIFSGCSSNIGTVYGNASFLDGSHNNGGCIVGIATVENGDPYFLNNVILLNGDGSTKQTNATFIDESSNNFQFNNSGSGVTQGSFSPFSINGWSNYFNGSSYLTLSNSFSTGLVGVGSGQTTFETWVYPTSLQTGNSGLNVLMGNSQSVTGNGRWDISLLSDVSGSGAGVYFGWSTGVSISATTGIQTVSSGIIKDAWNHVAVVVNATTPTGSSINIFVNGAKETFTGKNLSTQSGVYSQVQMGGNNNTRSNFIGYMSNFKVTKNQSVYTNTFTPSTTALTTTSQGTTASNVLLLTAQDNRFIDNSLSPKTFTNTSVNTQPLNPFKATQLYNPTINGASAYFGGSNRLNFTGNSSLVFGTGNFTIDFWVNPSSASGQNTVLKLGGTYQDVWIMIASGAARVDFWPAGTGSPTLRLTGGAIPLNTWSHIAIVREGTGTNQTKIYINGVVSVQGTLSYNFVDSGTSYIGGLAAADFMTGYISNLRVVKGTAVYTGTFTPPTAPTTTIADTSLLLNFTNGGITDTSSKAMLRTFGDVKASSSQIKYGNGSLFLDGSGDYLTVPTSGNLFKFGTGNFTVEFWIYPLAYGSSSVGAQIFGTVNASQSGYSINLGQDINSFRIISNATGTWADNLTVSTGNGPALNQWTHMAIVRNGANLTIYKNGVSVATTSSASTWTFDGTLAVIGRYNDGTTTRDFNGYIDDLRVTKGIARYTNTFTPPESALGLTN